MTRFSKLHLLKGMIDLFGGIRFRYMRLFDVRDGMRLLMGACAETLEVVVLAPADPHGEQPSLKGMQVLANDFEARSHLRGFDFSQNKSLRTLEILASSVKWTSSDGSPGAVAFLKHVLSTTAPTAFLTILVLYRDRDFYGAEQWRSQPPYRELLQTERAEEVTRQRWRFGVLREVRNVRDFQLQLCASVSSCVREEPVRISEESVAEEETKEGFSGFFSDPPVTYNPQRYRR